eukprot:COSAG04_NODE_2333_length_4312_cov_4.387135_1_plen_59_part_00
MGRHLSQELREREAANVRAGQREAVLRGERTALKEALTKLGTPNLPTKACHLFSFARV